MTPSIHLITDEDCVTMYARRFADILLALADAHTLSIVTDYADVDGYKPRKFIALMRAIVPFVTVVRWSEVTFDLQHHYNVADAHEQLAARVAELVRENVEYAFRGDTEKLPTALDGILHEIEDEPLDGVSLRDLRRDMDGGGK